MKIDQDRVGSMSLDAHESIFSLPARSAQFAGHNWASNGPSIDIPFESAPAALVYRQARISALSC